jgi:hypothetical protein
MVGRARDASPAELRRQLSGDLDNILLKSLSKEPLARYRSAGQLDEDVRRHLQGQPVVARGDALTYRLGRFLQRYKIWVIAAMAIAAAVSTGVVTIRPIGLLYLAGGLAALGLWYAATDRIMGRRIAGSGLWRSPLLGVVLMIAIPFVFWRYFQLASFPYVALFTGVVAWPPAIRWLTRGRWAGRLLLDLSQPTRKWRYYLEILVLILSLYICVTDPAQRRIFISIAVAQFAFFSFLIVGGRLEIREQGIMFKGRLLRWGNIESYEWDFAGRSRSIFLEVHLRRLLKALPPVRLPVPPDRRERVDALLSRYLSDWPAGGEPSARHSATMPDLGGYQCNSRAEI